MIKLPVIKHGKCKVCSNPTALVELRQLYFEWCDTARLSNWYNIPEEEIIKHIEASGWDLERARDTTGFYRAIIRLGGGEFLRDPSKLRSDTVTIAARQLDRIEGREQQPRKNMQDRQKEEVALEIFNLVQRGLPIQDAFQIFESQVPGIKDYYEEVSKAWKRQAH